MRPEDTKYYEDTIYIFDIDSDDLKKERTLFDIYKTDKKWNDDLAFLITNLGLTVDNMLLPDDFGIKRANCKQRCMGLSPCKYCEMAYFTQKMTNHLSDNLKQKTKEITNDIISEIDEKIQSLN